MFLSCRSWFFMVFTGFYNVSELLTMNTIVKTTKNHDFLSSRHNLKIMIFFVFIGCANVSELQVMVFDGFYGFYNVLEFLTMKTVVQTNKNYEFLISRHSLKINVFFLCLLAVPMFLSCRSWFLMVFMVFTMFLSS